MTPRSPDAFDIVDAPSVCTLQFNVMPGREVREDVEIRQYRIGRMWIEAEFDRRYESTMLHSPSHLTFVAALVQMQKIAYVFCCHRLGFDPDVSQPEHLKIWPTDLTISMTDLVRTERGLVHRMEFSLFKRLGPTKYVAVATTRIGDGLVINGRIMIQLLREP
jgi:hypothetical protein